MPKGRAPVMVRVSSRVRVGLRAPQPPSAARPRRITQSHFSLFFGSIRLVIALWARLTEYRPSREKTKQREVFFFTNPSMLQAGPPGAGAGVPTAAAQLRCTAPSDHGRPCQPRLLVLVATIPKTAFEPESCQVPVIGSTLFRSRLGILPSRKKQNGFVMFSTTP